MRQSIQQESILRGYWRAFWHTGWGWTLLPILSIGLSAWVTGWILSLPPTGRMMELRRVCDGAVKMLLTSHDLVEIERSNGLISNLDCDVGRRIGTDGAFYPLASQEH